MTVLTGTGALGGGVGYRLLILLEGATVAYAMGQNEEAAKTGRQVAADLL